MRRLMQSHHYINIDVMLLVGHRSSIERSAVRKAHGASRLGRHWHQSNVAWSHLLLDQTQFVLLSGSSSVTLSGITLF